MKWTKEIPTKAEYYWAIPKDKDNWLDGSPEIVKVYFNGKWMVFRPACSKVYHFDDFVAWSDEFIPLLLEKCQGCGDSEELIPLDCKSSSGWRTVNVCSDCMERLDADMWISEECWVALNPVVPFDDLPLKEDSP